MRKDAGIAQLVEHRTCNADVASSILAPGSKFDIPFRVRYTSPQYAIISKEGFVTTRPYRSNCRIALGALGLLVLAGTGQHSAWGQGGRGSGPPMPQGQNRNGMHVYIWAGLKSHGEGQHDYPQFLADWSKLLTEKGAVVDGSLHSPSAADLEHTDV